MASGSSYTVSGGTTMVGVAAGDVIDDADFNNARTNVNTLMGTAADVTLGTYTASSTKGWGQGGAGVNAASAGGLIYADNATGGFKRLQDDVQAMCAFLGQTVRTGVGSDVADGDSITAATFTNLMLNVQDCWNARFSPAGRTSATGNTKTYTSAWANSLSATATYTFANEGACRGYFNGGGRIGFSASRSGGSSTTQNTNWTNTLSAMGDVTLLHNTGAGSSGTNAGVGFYELTTSYKTLWTKFGSGSYASNFFKMEGLVNSTTNPTVVTLRATFSDPHAEGSGALGPDGVAGTGDEDFNNDGVDGTITLNGRTATPNASGSGFSFSAPTVSVGTISGS
tara:strand:- start:6677 stop:7696 length:1020 start_codon:yes stop_codon:yes gene_type:complete